MPDEEIFSESDNIADSLTKEEKLKIAQDVAFKFSETTKNIHLLIDRSVVAWDYYTNTRANINHELSPININKGIDRRGTTPIQNSDTESQTTMRLGDIPKAIDSVLSFQQASTFPSDERFFDGMPLNEVSKINKEIYQVFLTKNMARANTIEQLKMHRLNCMLDGTGCIHVPYKRKRRKKISYIAKSELELNEVLANEDATREELLDTSKVTQKVDSNFIEWEGTFVEPLSFEDWRIDPFAQSLEKTWFARRWFMDTKSVEEKYDLEPGSVQTHSDVFLRGGDTSHKEMKHRSFGIETVVPPPPIRSVEEDDVNRNGKDKALLIAFYHDFDLGDREFKNYVAITLNDEDVVWFGPNPYDHGLKPYIVQPYKRIPGMLYGVSDVAHAIPSAEVIYTAYDKVLASSSFGAVPVFLANITDEAVKANKDQPIQPGQKIPVTRSDSVQQLPISLANLDILREIINLNSKNIEDITGASPVLAGENPRVFGQNITAFQVDQFIQGTNTRNQSLITDFNNFTLEPLMFIAHENFKQFKQKTESVGDLGILESDMIKQFEFDWIITGGQATVSRNLEIQNLKELIDIIGQFQQQGGPIQPTGKLYEADVIELLIRLATKGGLRDADKLIQPVGEQPPTGIEQPGTDQLLGQVPAQPPPQQLPGPGQIPPELLALQPPA